MDARVEENGSGSASSRGAAKVGIGVGVSAGLATMFLLLRLLAVARWDWTDAAAIADSFDFSDAIPIVFGTLLAEPETTGLLIAILLPIAVLHLLWPADRSGPRWTPGSVVLVAALAACTVAWSLTFHSWWVLAGAVAVAGALIAIRLLWKHGAAHRTVLRIIRSAGALVAAGALLLATLVDTPWMSRERLVLPEGPVEGYVLEVEPGFVKLLTDERDVRIVPTEDVASRELIEE